MFRGAYTQAVVAINSYAQSKFGAEFTALTPAQQDQILGDMDRNQTTPQDPSVERQAGASAPLFLPNARAVFEMIRTHAVQGMFGDPMHGGNVNFVGWKLVRFPGPRLVISANDQKLNVVPRSSLKSTYAIPLFKPLARRN